MEDKIVTCRLADGREILIRQPSLDADLDRLLEFYAQLPAAVKNHLRYDVGANREIGVARLRQLDGKDHWRLLAELEDGTFIGDGTMDREPFGWTRHVASIRIVVSPDVEQRGVREALCEELLRVAQKVGIERIETEVLLEHESYLQFLSQLGFEREVVRKRRAKALDGKLHDLVIMSNDLERVWKRLEETVHEMDLSFARWSGGH
jgi:RimJ/RimL family protein N-acetyltransferase